MPDYYRDVLAQPVRRRQVPEVPAEPDLVVETADGAFCGAVVGWGRAVDAGEKRDTVTLEDRHGKRRVFPLLPAAFLVEGRVTTLVRPAPTAAQAGSPGPDGVGLVRGGRGAGPGRAGQPDLGRGGARRGAAPSASGATICVSRASSSSRSTAWTSWSRGSASSGPVRSGGSACWSNHLVPGSKESRIAAQVRDPDVLVNGHPYVDIWQAVKPTALGIAHWPEVPRGTNWKDGICAALGVSDPREMWRRVLASVDSYADVEVPLLRAVEELIDFVTA